MKEEDKKILDSINEFVLYCKNFYKTSEDKFADIISLLSPNYLCTNKNDVINIVVNHWSEWNEKLPFGIKLSIASFWRGINDEKVFTEMREDMKERRMRLQDRKDYKRHNADFNELTLNVIIHHIADMNPKYLHMMPPTYKKGKIRSGCDHQGMTYKEMRKLASRYFK